LLKKVPTSIVTCDTAGIISPTVQIVAAIQVAETLKLIVEDYSSFRNTYLTFDLWNNQHTSINVDNANVTNCNSCGESKTYPLNHSLLG
jgi:adenylyltransferase/sulfurtransferase